MRILKNESFLSVWMILSFRKLQQSNLYMETPKYTILLYPSHFFHHDSIQPLSVPFLIPTSGKGISQAWPPNKRMIRYFGVCIWYFDQRSTKKDEGEVNNAPCGSNSRPVISFSLAATRTTLLWPPHIWPPQTNSTIFETINHQCNVWWGRREWQHEIMPRKAWQGNDSRFFFGLSMKMKGGGASSR